ncbi:MAG TPA: SCO family protein [Steroidobacteraceae bacterium]|nr:SCO family protein [Steroidobacteraceae bacterium]
MQMKSSWFLWAAVAVLAMLAGFYLAQRTSESVPQLTSGTWFPQPRPIENFALTDETSQPFTLDTLKGHPTLVFFGFTHCPDVCPTTLAQLAQIAQTANVPQLRVLLVSVDPTRDTPEVLQQYVHAFDPSFKGVTGDPAQIERLAKEFGVAIARVDLSGGDYTVDHSAAVFLLDSQARRVAVFTPPFEVRPMAADLRNVADRLTG